MTQETWVDLHVHTNYSDGLLSPAQVVMKAKETGLRAVGISDHDTIEGISEAVEAGGDIDIEVVPGVELSSQCDGKDIHILGYYFDPNHPRLMEYLERFRKERYRRALKMVQNLNKVGIHLTIADVEERAKGQCIGRPHLAEVLMEKGYVETFQEAFHRYIGYGSKAYAEKYKLKPEEAIHLITEAKGLSFLAHPGYSITDDIILRFIKAGLDGIEIVHPKLSEQRTLHLQKIAHDHNLLVSGGSDCHGGRNGTLFIGEYNVPYSVLEEIKCVVRTRWEEKK